MKGNRYGGREGGKEGGRGRERERERKGKSRENQFIPILSVRFMDAGGWPMLNMWLVEAKKTQNIPLTVELLQVCTYIGC